MASFYFEQYEHGSLITHDVEEALLLSDRIYVLTERPARAKEEIQVQFPRTRTSDVLTSSEFIELKRRLFELL